MKKLKTGWVGLLVASLLMGMVFHVQSLSTFLDISDGGGEFDTIMRRAGCNFYFYDPVTFSPNQVVYPPLQVKDPEYQIPWGTPHFRCFFKEREAALKFEVRKAWITYEFVNESEAIPVQARVQARSVAFSDVFPGVDVRYTVGTDYILEEVILYEPQEVADLVQEIAFEGVIPIEKEGGIYFSNGEKFLFGIPPPVMYELQNPEVKCTGLHYQLEVSDGTCYLRKVVDEEGLKWLLDSERKYPVVVDATTQSFEDPWESSGLLPYGQYFGNLSEYVSPSTGSLTVKQTDFHLPGRGLDVVIERVYTTPAVFSTGCRGGCTEGSVFSPYYEDGPYCLENECPPVDVGNGWQLNFPWVGSDYIHFLDGTMYKKTSENHTGHHFTFADGVLTTNAGIQYHFSGGAVASITDIDGNTITFGYSGGHLRTITDTVGRVINFSYNDKGQLTQISYGNYTVTYSYSLEALASVTDPLGRVTSFHYDQRNNWLLTKVSYPAGGYTNYTYSFFPQEVEPPDPAGCFELRKYHVTDQAVYSQGLVRHTSYMYQGDFDGITVTMANVYNNQNLKKAVHEFNSNTNALVTEHCVKNAGGAQLQKVEYTYSERKEVTQEDIYMGTTYVYTKKYLYDSWGNLIFEENGGGEKTFYSYANTDCENVFRDWDGNIPEFSNQFFDSSVPLNVHTALAGSVCIQDDRVIETYCRYDGTGNLLETRQIFQAAADYSVFSGTFDENGQTSFPVDLTGVSLEGDAVLTITGLPKENQVTKTETYSMYMYCTWLNQGYWQGNKFYAQYVSKGWPPEPGYEPIGPFLHYPGTTGYQSYSKWVSGYTQYVKTTYTEPEDKYPHQTEYMFNGDWNVVTSNLESTTVYCSIPVEELVSGQNTLSFQESSSWMTKFEWALHIPHAVTPTEEVSTAFTYDSYGNLTSVTDALGSTTYFGYDTQYHAYVTSITNALNNTVFADYDFGRGFLTSITDAKGFTSSFEYDILGRVTKKINPDSTEKEAVYDDQNNTVTIYDELDHKTVRYYDGIGRLTKSEWYISETIKFTETYTYNYLNKVKTVTDPGGHVYSYEYDLFGRLTKQFNPDFTFREIQYNDIANTVTVLDENQHKREYCYDWVGNLVWVKEYTDSVSYYLTQYTYDSLGHLTSFIDANGNTTLYTRDSLFGVTQITYPDSTTESFVYNAVGNLLQKTNVHGTTTFTYDAACQLVYIQYSDQSSITYEYDANGNCTSMADPEGTTSHTYDNRNRCISETRTIEGEPYTITYQYDAVSTIVSIIYPDQTVITCEYDALNRLTAVSGYAEFTYNDGSLLASTIYANGVVTNYHYDDNDRPVSVQAAKGGTDLLFMSYHYDSVGNITQLEYNRLKNGQWEQSCETFQYDWLDRLVSAHGNHGLLSYLYDAVGNRTLLNDVTYTYNNMNELLSIDDGTVFTYDENGNVLTKTNEDTWSYAYDVRNQLLQVEKNQQTTAQYKYDGNGRRIQKTEWIESLQEFHTTIYVYSGLDVIYEKNLTTDQEAVYIYGTTGKIAKKVNEFTDYYHTDHLGSTRLLTDESGNVISEVQYKAFGESEPREESYLYTGKEKDSTGLYYYGARYYDPDTGRFISRDPQFGQKENPQTFNRYVYCLNNPLKYVDPDGKEVCYSNPYKSLKRKRRVLQYSNVPQFLQYVDLEGYDGEVFFYLCIVCGIVLAGMGFYAAIMLWPVIGPALISLARTLAAVGSKVASIILGKLGGMKSIMAGLSYVKIAKLLGRLALAIFALINMIEECGDCDVDFDLLSWGFMLTVTFEDGSQWGWVTILDGPDYQWKSTIDEEGNRTYYVLIDGEWVEMPPGWKPGNPLPTILSWPPGAT